MFMLYVVEFEDIIFSIMIHTYIHTQFEMLGYHFLI